MDELEIQTNIRFWQAVALAYGYEMVSAAEAYQAFENHAQLAQRGFGKTKPGLYCRDASDGIIHVVKLQALKGGIYVPSWGVSLGFMPHSWRPQVRRHPGLKAAHLDIFERPVPRSQSRRQLWEIGGISILHGYTYMAATLRSMWRDYESDIFEWFTNVATLEDCLSVARAQTTSSNWMYKTHSPSPQLVCSFLLAKLGHIDEALGELDSYCARHENAQFQAALERALLETR
jgi:hypothetical protein